MNNSVLLIRPGNPMGRAGEHALQHPIGLCWLAACLRDAGFEPRILDFEVTPYSERSFSRIVAETRPAAVGFTAMTTVVSLAADMAAAVKTASPETAVIIGGAHASMFPTRTLAEYPSIDAASVGDGERRIVDVCIAARDGALAESSIPGTAVRRSTEIFDNTANPGPPLELDSLPNPARDLLDFNLYRGASTPGFPSGVFNATELFTSRGCPAKCIFCCSENVFGRKVRYRGVPHVMAEVNECIARFGFNHFTIDDDTFTTRRGRALEFCEAMAALPATWDCDTRVDSIDRELIFAMARSGCRKIAFGVESGSPKILKKIKKGITLDQVRSAFAWTHEAGVMSCAFFMVGNHPDETRDDISLTWKLIKEISPGLISVLLATPYPGTELYEVMKQRGLLPGEVPWSAYAQSFSFTGESFSRTSTLSSAELKKLQSGLLKKFYLRPSYIARRLAALRSPAELRYWVSAGLGFIKFAFSKTKEQRIDVP